jgi:hypothetical protein
MKSGDSFFFFCSAFLLPTSANRILLGAHAPGILPTPRSP